MSTEQQENSLKLSFCTTCKGRIEHIKQTLRKNIDDNQGANVEFVLLDYNSEDGLQQYIKDNFAAEIESGVLRYVYFPDPEKFHMAHAKNMSHRAATGDILVNLDGDNFTGKGFAQHVIDTFTQAKNPIFMRVDEDTRKALSAEGVDGIAGRIAVAKQDFYALGGYDEKFKGWGADDLNFDRRLQQYGRKKVAIDRDYLSDVKHDDATRVASTDQNVILMYAQGFAAERNPIPPKAQPNGGAFGCGTVYINFSDEPTELNAIDMPSRGLQHMRARERGVMTR